MANGFTREQHNTAAANIGDLFERAHLFFDGADKNAEKEVKSIKRFASLIVFDGVPAEADILVKETEQGGNRIYTVELQEIKMPSERGTESIKVNHDVATPTSDGKDKVAEEAAKVNGIRYSFVEPTFPLAPRSDFAKVDVGGNMPVPFAGNKKTIIEAHPELFARLGALAQSLGGKVIDAFAGAGTYTAGLGSLGVLPQGSVLNEWAASRYVMHKMLAKNPQGVAEAMRDLVKRFAESAELKAFRQRLADIQSGKASKEKSTQVLVDWFNDELSGKHGVEYVDGNGNSEFGDANLKENERSAAFYMFLQTLMTGSHPVNFKFDAKGKLFIEVADGVFRTGHLSTRLINAKGGFNENALNPEKYIKRIEAAGKIYQNAKLDVRRGDGWSLAKTAKRGDVVFVDPAYLGVQAYGGKKGKTAADANSKEEAIEKLADLIKWAEANGVSVVYTNEYSDKSGAKGMSQEEYAEVWKEALARSGSETAGVNYFDREARGMGKAGEARADIVFVAGQASYLLKPSRAELDLLKEKHGFKTDAEAEARVSAFGRLGKCVFFSQGSIAGDDCDRKFQATDRREWHFCCPECGAFQAYKWENIHWDAAAKSETTGEWDFRRVKATANLSCEVCGHAFRDTPGERSRLNAGGKFIAQNPNAAAEHVGFHWNALATMSWGELAETFLRAKAEARKGRTEDLAAFYQQRLALAWCEDSDYSADEVFENQPSGNTYLMGASDWDLEGVADAASRRFVPAREHTDAADAPRLRFLTVDVQDGYFVYVVRAWSPAGGRSRLIWCGIAQTFGDLADIRTKFCVPAKFVFIDAGFATQRVFAWCAETGAIAFQGDRAGKANYRHPDGKFRFYSPKRLARAGNASRAAETYFFSNISCKDKLSDLRREGGDVWGLPADIPEEYVKQLGAEYRSNVNGKPIWLKRGNRANHYWDCEVMQVAAAFLMKVF